MTDVSDPSADYAFGYDDVGRTTSITADLDGFTQSIVMAQTFDAASNRTQLAATIGTTADFVDDFTFDNLLRMTGIERQGASGGNTVAEIRVDIAYNALGQFATIDRYADLAGTKLAVTSAYGYDGANRLASLYHTQSTNDLALYDFTWDNADRLTSIDSLQDGVTNFTYDVTNQLTAADFATQSDETHAWTANGNPTGGGYTVTANNRVSTDGTYNYTYDNEGNRTRKTKISDGSYTDYVWDHRNRLMSVISKTSGGTITQQVDYAYDFLNQLITRTIDTDGAGAASPTSQWFAYSDGQIVLSFDSSSATTPDHRYLWGSQVDQLFADENSTNDLLYPLGDQVGTLRDIAQYDDGTDTTTVVNHIIFSSFNAQLSSSNSAYDILFGQTGRLHDAATGLDNHLHRWLDAWLKQWIGEDPIGFAGKTFNLREYVGNHPAYATDPKGLAEGHHWTPLSVVYNLFDEGVLSAADRDYFAGRMSGALQGGHKWSDVHNGVKHSEYNIEIDKQLRDWKKHGKKTTVVKVVDNIQVGKGWNGKSVDTIEKFNSGVTSKVIDAQEMNRLNTGTVADTQARGYRSLVKRGKLLAIFGAIFSQVKVVDAATKSSKLAEILTQSEAMNKAVAAAESGDASTLERFLTSTGKEPPSVYDLLAGEDILFAKTFRVAALKGMKNQGLDPE